MTGLAQLVAEELECDWKKVATEFPTPGESLARKRVWGEMGTGGSRGIRTSQDYVRKGGAAARMMLLQAAADQWKVPVTELTVVERRHHARSIEAHDDVRQGRRRGCEAAAARSRDDQAQGSEGLEDRRQADEAARHGGQAQRPPGLCDRRQAARNALRRDQGLPVFGGKLVSFDESKIAGRAGGPRAVRVNDSTVAVVADTWWRAKTALDALPIVWDEGPNAAQSSATIAAHLKEGLAAPTAYAMRNEGDALKAIAGAAKKVEAEYSTPFLAHATMEPMNCTAKITPDRAEVWVATQNAEASLAALSEASGLPLEKCDVYKHLLGGGFGRRGGAQDYVRQAVAIAKQFPGVPIKMIWSREEDMTHDFYRPISQCRAVGRARRERQARRPARSRVGAVDQRVPEPGGSEGRPRRSPAAGLLRRGGRRAARVHGAEPADRVRDAQHARAGGSVARREHEPERRLHGVLHRRGGAGRERRSGRVPPRADAEASEAPRRAERGRGEGRLGQAAAAGRPPRRRAVHGLRQLLGGRRRSVGERQGQAQGPPHGAGRGLRPRGQSRPDRRAGRRLRRVRARARRSTASARSTRAASPRPTSTPTRSCDSRTCRRSKR